MLKSVAMHTSRSPTPSGYARHEALAAVQLSQTNNCLVLRLRHTCAVERQQNGRQLTGHVARLRWGGPSLLIQCLSMPDQSSTQWIHRLRSHDLRKQGEVADRTVTPAIALGGGPNTYWKEADHCRIPRTPSYASSRRCNGQT